MTWTPEEQAERDRTILATIQKETEEAELRAILRTILHGLYDLGQPVPSLEEITTWAEEEREAWIEQAVTKLWEAKAEGRIIAWTPEEREARLRREAELRGRRRKAILVRSRFHDLVQPVPSAVPVPLMASSGSEQVEIEQMAAYLAPDEEHSALVRLRLSQFYRPEHEADTHPWDAWSADEGPGGDSLTLVPIKGLGWLVAWQPASLAARDTWTIWTEAPEKWGPVKMVFLLDSFIALLRGDYDVLLSADVEIRLNSEKQLVKYGFDDLTVDALTMSEPYWQREEQDAEEGDNDLDA